MSRVPMFALFAMLLPIAVVAQEKKIGVSTKAQTSVSPSRVVISEAHDVSLGGTPGLLLLVGVEASLNLPANQICVVTATGERKCDWKMIPFVSWFKTKANTEATTLKIDGTFESPSPSSYPLVYWVDGSAELAVEGGLAKLLFVGTDKSHATSFRFGSLAPVTIPNRIQDAAQDGDLGRVKVLLRGNPALVSSKYNGDTALHHAAMADHIDVVEFLLSNGAEVNAKNMFGDTPLALAVIKDNKAVIRVLRQHGGHE